MEGYDRQGKPVSMRELEELLMDISYKRIAITEIGPYVVSTVWLGLDHRFIGEGPPVIFETMVFTSNAWNSDRTAPDHEPLYDIDCDRYCTEEEARQGHEAMCLLIRATLQDTPPNQKEETECPDSSSSSSDS